MIFGKWGNRLFVLLFVAVTIGSLVQTRRLEEARQVVSTVALRADSLAAARDSTRVIHIEGVVAGDLMAVQRRAVQAEQRVDSLDRALGQVRAGWAQFRTSVRGLNAMAKSETVYVSATDSARHATFDLRQAPYTVHAAVEAPPAPAPWTMAARVDLDTIAMDARVGCGRADRNGVRSAALTVVGPTWASVRLGRVEQLPEVCTAPDRVARSGLRALLGDVVGRLGVSVGYGVARQASGAVVAGPGVLAGIRVWP